MAGEFDGEGNVKDDILQVVVTPTARYICGPLAEYTCRTEEDMRAISEMRAARDEVLGPRATQTAKKHRTAFKNSEHAILVKVQGHSYSFGLTVESGQSTDAPTAAGKVINNTLDAHQLCTK